ncbi:DUF4249 domain-containing protein [uncultured Maribacter sp.]|uniref:DUF4249 domain-containing protein n=1 Tax=uncultured Maribacter sp. TaxID=431308 RepID=UPI002626CC01|nr:DUF4249 domain-containing protein [uncultured Maribacter sp.]
MEEIEIDTLNENESQLALVVEAALTNELITQTVYLSRSSVNLDLETDTIYNPFIPLGSRPFDTVDWEIGATVTLLSESGEEFEFTEAEDGVYLSNTLFALQMGVNYTLDISRNNGQEYESDPIYIQGTSRVTNMYAEKAENDNGEEGIAIYVDSEPVDGNAKYFKYTYDETYKIVAPYWQNFEFELTDYDGVDDVLDYSLEVVEKEVEDRICYNTVSSNTIDVFSTDGVSEGNVNKHKVRFITKDNFIIAQRYSILVQQQVQSADANSFYKILQSFSESDNVFSQIQPGGIYANVHRKDGAFENVYGQVEAVGVTDQRIFLNYEDFFSEETPPYAFNCGFETAKLFNSPFDPCPQGLLARIDLGTVSYYSDYLENLVPNANPICVGPFIFVPRICGDCTLLGSNIKPDFWIE